MKPIVLYLLLSVVEFSGKSQVIHHIGHLKGSDTDRPTSITSDPGGNIIVGGSFTESLDFDPGPAVDIHYGGFDTGDCFVIKFDPNGNYIWGHDIGGSGANDEQCYCVTTDPEGNVYLIGDFDYSSDFNPGSGSYVLSGSGGADGFILKLSPNGDFIWARDVGSSGDDYMNEIKVGTNGVVYSIGSIEDSSDFNPLSGVNMDYTYGSSDEFIWALDTAGNYLWHFLIGGNNGDDMNNLSLDANNNIYVAFRFGNSDSIDIDPSAADVWLYDQDGEAVIIKYDSNGNLIWYHQYPNILNFSLTNSGEEIFVISHILSTFDFDFGPGVDTLNISSNVGFLHVLDTSGQHMAVDYFRGQNAYSKRFLLDSINNIYQVESFYNTLSFIDNSTDDDLSSLGFSDIAISKYTSTGDFLFSAQMGGLDYDFANSFWIKGDSLLITGTFRAQADFDPTPGLLNIIPNWVDGFVASYGICSISPVILSDTSFVLTASLSGGTYQWLDCNNSMLPIPGETYQTFTASQNGEYALVVTYDGCTDTTQCHTINGIGIPEDNQPHIKIAPNPSRDFITIFSNLPDNLQLNIYAISGELLISKQCVIANNFIDISTLSTGIYVMEFIYDGNMYREKLIKE